MLDTHLPRLVMPIAALLVTAVACGNVESATFHVAMSGDDTAAGTAAAPWRTIQKAVAIARAGDTVVVHGGDHVPTDFGSLRLSPVDKISYNVGGG